MEKSLRLHKEHGVNPSVSSCFFCGGDKDVILFGAGYPGQAPMHCGVADMQPCPECEKMMERGCIIVSISDGERPDDPKVIPNPFRTGGWWVVKDEAIKRLPFDENVIKSILAKRFTFMEDNVCKVLGLKIPEAKNDKIT